MQLVVVKFEDSTTFDHWVSIEEVDESKCKVCIAVGVLVEENAKVTKVALLYSEDKKAVSNWIAIPTACILSCDIIKEIDWEVSVA